MTSKPMSNGGKGSVRRNEDNDAYQRGWDAIFGKKKEKEQPMIEREYEEDEGYDICHRCSGSGEGMYDSSVCSLCNGTGEEPVEKEFDDGFLDFSNDDDNNDYNDN